MKRGFTLAELLVVTAIIAVLYAISLAVIRTARHHVYRTITRAEVSSIESALKQYYAHYGFWPLKHDFSSDEEDIRLDGELARALMGNCSGEEEREINPDKIIFMEFARMNDSVELARPLNPWGEAKIFADEDCAYYARFDYDGDGELSLPFDSSKKIRRGIIVWSRDPELLKSDESEDKDYIGSWQ